MINGKQIKVACGLFKVSDGYVLVHEKEYNDTLVKCAGGRTDEQPPIIALIREFGEEMYAEINESNIKNHVDVEREDYIMRFFNVINDSISSKELKPGEEIEFIKVFPNKKALEMAICYEEIVSWHVKAITELLKSA